VVVGVLPGVGVELSLVGVIVAAILSPFASDCGYGELTSGSKVEGMGVSDVFPGKYPPGCR
jgi:hypothetical protein